MPALRDADVAHAVALVRDFLGRYGPGEVVTYRALSEALRGVLPAQRRLHLLRAACEQMRAAGEVELHARSLRDGRWVITHVRLPGRGEAPAPARRMKWQPRVKRKGRYVVAPELLRKVEAVILELLEGPHDPREVLLAAHPRPLPGPGWVPYYYLTCRVGQHIELHPSTRHNTIGIAARSLAGRGRVSLLAHRQRDGKRRVRWVRLAPSMPPAVQSVVAPPLFTRKVHAEPNRL